MPGSEVGFSCVDFGLTLHKEKTEEEPGLHRISTLTILKDS